MAKTVLAIVGPMAAGKGTFIEILKKKGFESSSTSDRIREEIIRRGLQITRNSLTEVANDLRSQFGNDILSKRTAEYLGNAKSDYFVIDSIRNPKEIEFFKSQYDMKVVAITADQKIRYERFIERKTNSEPMSFEQFCDIDNKELHGDGGSHSQRVEDCMKMADKTLENNGSVEDLEKRVDEMLAEFNIQAAN